MTSKHQADIHTIFEPKTGTWQYIVADPKTKEAVIIDSVLDFDPASSTLSTTSADNVLAEISKHGYTITHILETHAHADHLTASRYLQSTLQKQGQPRPSIGIGKRITQVQATFAPKYGVDEKHLSDTFDILFDDNATFAVGCLEAKVLHLPGHTPDHVGYQIGTAVFTGDSIFNPDVGSARCDFPGGSATDLFRSMRTLLALPDYFRLYTGHDYPPGERGTPLPYTTVAEQNERNKHVKKGVEEAQFVQWRRERDARLGEPRLLHQALQFNIRGGSLPEVTEGGLRFLRVPVKVPAAMV